jgi:uncharacterized membrane protein
MKRRYVIASWMLGVAVLLVTAIVYQQLPETVPIHWDLNGNANGYGSRITVFLLPGILLLMNILLFSTLPWISPKRFKVDRFLKTYDFVMFLVIALIAYIHILILHASSAGTIDMGRALPGGFFLFFALIGNVMGRVRRNFWVGVRTPWTLANERVWNDTHRLAGRLFVLSGIISFLLTIGGIPIVIPMILIGIAATWAAIYSLVAYKRLEREGQI